MNQHSVGSLASALQQGLDQEELANCMRCGFCLPACPTFNETGFEAESPRGRIALMKAVSDGIMAPDDAFEQQMNHCLGCRACEPACPAGVRYGQLLEQSREAIEQHKVHRWPIRLLRYVMFRQLFPHRKRMKVLAFLLQLYQRSGLNWLVRKIGLMKLFPTQLAEMEAVMPSASPRGVVEKLGAEIVPAEGKKLARVALFSGCIMDVLFSETNTRTAKLLAASGFEVVIPKSQQCCGALHAHGGEMEQARALAKQNIASFETEAVDFVISNAGGCGALLSEYDDLLKAEPEWAERAKSFASKVKDVCDLIVEKGRIPDFADDEVTVTYQDSCHLRNVMGGGSAPRQLLTQLGEKVKFVELTEAESCCGSAGIYNLTQPAMADQLLQTKMEHVEVTEADILLSSNPGCMMQMMNGVQKNPQTKERMRVMHIVDFLYLRLKS